MKPILNHRDAMSTERRSRNPLECGDSSPLSRRRLVAVEVLHGSNPARTPPLARAANAPHQADALLRPTATSRLEKAVTSHRTPNAPPVWWRLAFSVFIVSLWSNSPFHPMKPLLIFACALLAASRSLAAPADPITDLRATPAAVTLVNPQRPHSLIVQARTKGGYDLDHHRHRRRPLGHQQR